MFRGNNRETILKVAFACLIVSYLSDGAPTTPSTVKPSNIAVYEGTLNTIINFTAINKGVKWSNTATTDELTDAIIVNYDDTVNPSFVADYAFNSSVLTIKNATITAASGHELSTAGLYTAEYGGGRFSFKFLVVRSGRPNCSCTTKNSTVHLSCSSIYADSTYDPINAIFSWVVNGNLYNTSDPPRRTNNDAYTYISTSTFTTAYSNSSSYQCVQTFDKPTEVQDSSVAINQPIFSHNVSCSCPAPRV